MTNFANLSMDTTYNTLYFNTNFRSRNALYFEGVYLNKLVVNFCSKLDFSSFDQVYRKYINTYNIKPNSVEIYNMIYINLI